MRTDAYGLPEHRIAGDLVLNAHEAAGRVLSPEEYMRWRSVHAEVVEAVLPHPPFKRTPTIIKDKAGKIVSCTYKYVDLWPDEIWRVYAARVVQAWMEFTPSAQTEATSQPPPSRGTP